MSTTEMQGEWNVVFGLACAIVCGASGLTGWAWTFAASTWVAVVCLDLLRR